MTDIKFKAVKVQGKVTKSHRLPIKRLRFTKFSQQINEREIVVHQKSFSVAQLRIFNDVV